MLKIKQDPEKLQKTKKILRDSISRGKKAQTVKKNRSSSHRREKKSGTKRKSEKISQIGSRMHLI
jgi:hypothetical protein